VRPTGVVKDGATICPRTALASHSSILRRRPATAAIARFHRLTQLSWPKRYPLVQFPNAPLILAFLAGQAASALHGGAHPYLAAVSYLAMIVWAYEEVAHGVNRFRNLLGLGYAISTAVHLGLALQR
jgi:hypothetical protein